jgi:SAM-dependent methyltransferase
MDLSPIASGVVATDLTNCGLRTAAFDVIVCFHVLEHIPDDLGAMAELRRCLRPGGQLVVQVPLREGFKTEEDVSASPADKLRRFGKDDHVRYYGDDIIDRLESTGFRVSKSRPIDWLNDNLYRRYALAGDDQVLLVCE